MEVITYLKIIARYWWLILLASVVSTGMATGIAFTKSKSYSAQALVVVRPSVGALSDTRTYVDMMSNLGTRSVIGTFSQLFTSSSVQQKAEAAVGMSEASAQDYPVEANILPDTTVIEVSAKGHNPKLLADYVNATMDAAVAQGSGLFEVLELQPLERATVPKDPTSPVPSRDIPIGGLLGLGLGVLLALVIEYMRTPRRQESVQYEPQIRSLVPGVPGLPALPPSPAPQPLTRED